MTDAAPGRIAPVADGESVGPMFGLALAIVVGGLVRLLPSVGAAFPLNDGGLFVTMIEDLVRNGLLLPASTTYNGQDIPFAYPPLALYIAALANAAAGIPITDLLRTLPFLFSVLTIPAVYWAAERILQSRPAGALAALAFALLPRSYQWMITGGGITRALGFLLAVIAIGIAWRLLRSREHRWWVAVMLGLVGGLTALAHPQAAFFMTLTIVVMLPAADGWRVPLVRVVAAGAIGFVVILPWLAAVVRQHGIEPLMSAFSTGGGTTEGIFNLLSYRLTGMVFIDVIAIVGLLGVAVAIRRRDFLLPVWLAAILVLDSRAGATFGMVPIAMLAAYFLREVAGSWFPEPGERPFAYAARHRWRSVAAIVVLLALVFGNYLSALVETSPLFALSPDQRAGMAWAEESTPADAAIAVVTAGSHWETDAVSEWFPTLANRMSVATVQGFEWLGPGAWDQRRDAYEELQECGRDVLPCVIDWAARHEIAITHIYLPSGQLNGPLSTFDCCPAPRHSVELVPGARVIYNGPGATIIAMP